MESLAPYFKYWRSITVRDRQIVDAVVSPEHAGPSRELARALKASGTTHYWSRERGGRRLVVIRSLAPAPRERWALHLLLFALTFLTVLVAGAVLTGQSQSLLPVLNGGVNLAQSLADWWQGVSPGLGFAAAVMGILLCHELGHYVLALRYRINASPPYFLPAPSFNIVGTFGAFIRIRSPIVDRRQLMDVGAAGPWAGFAVAMACLLVGLEASPVVGTAASGQMILIGDLRLALGDSLLLGWTRELLGIEGTVVMHPLAFAGWLGLFVTTLNLLPLGQLDGGHVLYALVGERQKWFGWLAWFGLIALGFHFWAWWFWAALTLILGRGRLSHPSVLDRHRPIPVSRVPLGWATVGLFVVTFIPVPFPL